MQERAPAHPAYGAKGSSTMDTRYDAASGTARASLAMRPLRDDHGAAA